MERLTQRCNCGICGSNEKVLLYPLYKIGGDEYMDHGLINQCFEKLAQYEDAEEQGLLLRLPCKIGDKFWEMNTALSEPCVYSRVAHSLQHIVYCMERLGKTTFLTKEEAEAALEKLKGEEHG